MTAQEIIKSFMNQLANHGYAYSDSIGANMLDSAVRASSRYTDIQEVIDAMKVDQTAAEKEAVEEVLGSEYAGKTISEIPFYILSADAKDYDPDNKSNAYYNEANDERSTVENFIKERKATIFLEKYCGILLNKKFWFDSSGTSKTWSVLTDSTDTGAITGSDAGGSTTKTAQSVVPEIFINTYIASTSTAQNIITDDRDWVVKATSANDTITANGADSVNAGAGNDCIIANADGATVTSGKGNDFITLSEGVNDITLSDLNSYDTLTINGTFEVGSAQIEDTLLVVTDKTGKRKIRLGNFDNAKACKINSTTIGAWLINAGIDLNNLTTKNYSDGKVVESSNVANESAAVTVNLANVDTSKTGKVKIGGKKVGSLSSTFPNASTFTRNGLTIHLLGVSSNTSGSTSKIEAKTLDELTDDQKTIIAGLFKWWVGASLTLSEESYGISFNSPTAMVKDMGVFFYDSQSNNSVLAATPYWPRSDDGAITQLMLKINMNYFKDISSDNVDGSTTAVKNLLDRTLAHELTHSNMETNINYFVELPQFIIEGAAELVHGIDDERGNRIFQIAADSTTLDTVLDVTNTGTGDSNYYAGGYMFLRYFAKHAATNELPAFGEITATVKPAKNGNYYISGNSTAETASTTAQSINLGTVSKGVYTLKNTGVHQVINNTGNLKIVGLTVNDTLIGSDAADIVETSEGSFITTGKGADSIKVSGQFATIDTGAGNDTVIAKNGGHHFVNLGDGNNLIKLNQEYTYANTVVSGAGNDSISIKYSAYDSSIITGAGNDSISLRGEGNTICAGEGNDYIFNSNASDNTFIYSAGDGSDTIQGFDATSTLIINAESGTYTTAEKNSDIIVKVGKGSITLKDAASLNAVNIEGKNTSLVTLTEDADVYKNTADNVTIKALGGDDSISNYGANVLIYGGDGDDTLSGGKSKDILDGGDGDDILMGGTGKDTFAYSGGNDTIRNYTGKDRLSLASAYEDFATNGDDLIFNFSNADSLTIENGAGKAININSTVNYYTANGILDSKKESITLSASTEIFTADSKLVMIDGSATDSVSIVGNGKKNIIYAGAGNSTLAGGKGNDTLYGGAGNDIFIYNNKDGKDVIENCGTGDKISLGNGATIKSFEMKNGNTIIKIGSGSLTVKNTSEFIFMENGVEKIFNDGNISDADEISVTLSPTYKGTFELGDYKTVDASLTKKTVKLVGNAQDNYLTGGKGKNSLIGGAGNDTLWGGKKNDTLTGGDGDDIFIYKAGEGNDTILDYSSGDMLQILDKKGKAGTFGKATFKDDTLTLSIKGGGKVIFENVAATATFNINATTYKVNGNSLAK